MRTRRMIAVVVGIAVIAAAVVYIAVRTLSGESRNGLAQSSQPSISDVLDGYATSGARASALQSVDDLGRGIKPAHTSAAGTTQFTRCEQGANDWKRRDPYRLICTAYSRVYRAWSGEFATGMKSANLAIASICVGPEGGAVRETPAPQVETSSESYSCDPDIAVSVTFGTSRGLQPSDPIVSQASDLPFSRRVGGPSPEALVDGLSEHEWFVVCQVGKVFYRD